MYKIYCIEDINDEKYIGKTKNKLYKRFCNHICEYRNHYGKCSSHKLNLYNSIIYVLEDNLTEEQAVERETYYLQNTECVNKQKNHNDDKIYKKKYRSKEENKQIEREGKKKWYYKNREQILDYQKERRKSKWYCETCKCEILLQHKARHLKTNKHKNNLN